MGKLTDFILGGSKITADADRSHEIKTCLLLGRKVMSNLDSILKSRDYSRFFYFHTNCEITCSSSVKNTVGTLIGIALNL